MSKHCVIFISTGSKEEAEKVSQGLVEDKLAFCVSSIPKMQSTYYWEDKIHVDEEFLLIVKTRTDHYEAVERWIKNIHIYKFPEFFSLLIDQGLPSYVYGIDILLVKKA